MSEKSLQQIYAPNLRCFGCGPANERGLHISSFVRGHELVAEWQPQPHHESFGGFMNGGIIGTLLDCHSAWAAAWNIAGYRNGDTLPSTVTADYHVKLLRPARLDLPVKLVARAAEVSDRKAVIEAELLSGGEVCATCRGTFVKVKPGHPAYHNFGHPVD
jgi:acyl-coenzyme A thioesterase PaaI-like protein